MVTEIPAHDLVDGILVAIFIDDEAGQLHDVGQGAPGGCENRLQVLHGELGLGCRIFWYAGELGRHMWVAVVDRGCGHAGQKDQGAGPNLDGWRIRHVPLRVVSLDMDKLDISCHALLLDRFVAAYPMSPPAIKSG